MFSVFTEGTMPRIDLQLAAEADVDPRSARKAMRQGAKAVKGRAGARLAEAAEALHVTLPTADPPLEPSGT
jgi:hypothetical protein